MRPAKTFIYGASFMLGAVLLWLLGNWVAGQLPWTLLRGDRATAAVTKLWQAPLPEGAEVIAVLSDGFQDPFLKIRIEAPPAQRSDMLVFLGVQENDLRQGRPHQRPNGPEDWWISPTSPGSVLFADLKVGSFDGGDLTLRTIDGPPARDIYFLYLWTM